MHFEKDRTLRQHSRSQKRGTQKHSQQAKICMKISFSLEKCESLDNSAKQATNKGEVFCSFDSRDAFPGCKNKSFLSACQGP